jgi:hypothetical protein
MGLMMVAVEWQEEHRNVTSYCEKDEGTDFEDGDSDTVKEDGI